MTLALVGCSCGCLSFSDALHDLGKACVLLQVGLMEFFLHRIALTFHLNYPIDKSAHLLIALLATALKRDSLLESALAH